MFFFLIYTYFCNEKLEFDTKVWTKKNDGETIVYYCKKNLKKKERRKCYYLFVGFVFSQFLFFKFLFAI